MRGCAGGYENASRAQTVAMITKREWWQMFAKSGRIEFYNAYKALGEGKDGQEGQGDRDEGGAV